MRINKLKAFAVSALALFLLAGCNGDGVAAEKEEICNLGYNGEAITWDSVKGAEHYIVKINGGNEKLVSKQSKRVSIEYEAKDDTFEFYVEAVIKEGSDNNPRYTINFEKLPTVQNLRIEDGRCMWDEINEAESYELMLGKDILNENINYNYYELPSGSFAIKVRAAKGDSEAVNGNNKYFSLWSDALKGEILETPGNLKYDSEKFTWDAVRGATGYVIKLGDEQYEVIDNEYPFTSINKDFDIVIKAKGNGDKVYDSLYSEPKSYTYIEPINSLTVENGNLVWNKPDNAVKYKIKINGIVQKELLADNIYEGLDPQRSYRIQILPIGQSDFFFSTWSNEVTVNVLKSPTLTYKNNILQWNQIQAASGYTVRIDLDGKTIDTKTLDSETFTLNYNFEGIGSYSVYIKANSIGGNGVYESKYSNPLKVTKLKSPTNPVVQNQPLEQNQVMITCTPVANAKSYQLLCNGVVIETNNKPTFNVDISKFGSTHGESIVKLGIKTVGYVNNNDVYLDSADTLDFNVTKLQTPENLQINGTTLTWDSVNNTNKYIITIDGKRVELTSTSYQFTNLSAGSHDIYVQAMGNSGDVVSSSYSNVLKVEKLQTPTGLKLQKLSDELYYLVWTPVNGTTAYKVMVAGKTYDATTNHFNISGYESYFTEGAGSQVSVYAIGNGSNIVDSDVSQTKTVVRYKTPNSIQIIDNNLVWSADMVDSINPTEYTLFVDDKEIVVKGTSYSIANLEAGSHTVRVMVNGDYVTTINSPISASLTFEKLAKVTNVKGVSNKLTWDAIENANGYSVKLSQDSAPVIVNTNEIAMDYRNAGEYAVTIIALGDAKTIVDSDAYKHTQKVEAIAQPVKYDALTNNNAFTVVQEGNRLTITIKENPNATGYKLIVGGKEITQTSNVFTYDMQDQGMDYGIQVQIIANQYGDNGIFYISSNVSVVYNFKF